VTAKDEWVMAAGGRCYLRAEAKKCILTAVKCPKAGCNRELADQWGYETHYYACHSKED